MYEDDPTEDSIEPRDDNNAFIFGGYYNVYDVINIRGLYHFFYIFHRGGRHRRKPHKANLHTQGAHGAHTGLAPFAFARAPYPRINQRMDK